MIYDARRGNFAPLTVPEGFKKLNGISYDDIVSWILDRGLKFTRQVVKDTGPRIFYMDRIITLDPAHKNSLESQFGEPRFKGRQGPCYRAFYQVRLLNSVSRSAQGREILDQGGLVQLTYVKYNKK